MVGRSGAVEELSRSVDCGRSGELCGAVDAGAAESGAIPAGSGKGSAGCSQKEQGWRAAARCWTGDARATAGVVAFSRRIRGDQLRTRDVAVSHAAHDAARFRSGVPFAEGTGQSGGDLRGAVLPRAAKN